MKKLKYILTGMIGTLFFTYSCDMVGPIDDIKPLYKLTEETTFSDVTKTEAVLSGVYTAWRKGSLNTYTGYTHLLSGDYSNVTLLGIYGTDLFENRVNVDDPNLIGFYSDFYGIIQRANYLINAMQSEIVIPGLTTARRLEIEAEARLQRAMGHFFLLRNFGQFYDLNSDLGIVIEEVPVRGSADDPRSTVQESYNLILSDLDFAMANAPAIASVGRLSRHAAKAMKAKVLLYMENWTGAASLALETINSGVYKLKPDFRVVYTKGYTSDEVIFSPISIFPNGISYAGSYLFKPGQSLIALADKSVGTSSDGNMVTGAGFDPRFAYAHATSTTPSDVYNNKYPFPQVNGQQAGSTFILRLGEMYLIYAEAKARLAANVDADALDKLNNIRNRAGLSDAAPTTKAELLEMIRLEKKLELFGEFNEPWFDMVRYHVLGNVNITALKATITSNNQLILPYPTLALSGNGGLVQNPGY
ncbi:MAG: hypothetical protein CVU00_09770 [Bacteroidetes bacterium HGW-Bacteroidetes-17]|jgi:hypothetical protein|nr:MAG: hypothetical protein CVU00_09770 [Bacteroidetes bacterium HGW-Bacteroidetes-17]